MKEDLEKTLNNEFDAEGLKNGIDIAEWQNISGDSIELDGILRKRSMNCAIVSSIAAIIGCGCIVGSILSLLAIKLGAGEIFLGFLSFATLAPLVSSLFTMSAIEKLGKQKILFRWLLGSAFFVIPFLLLPLFLNFFHWSSRTCLIIILAASFFRSSTTALGITGWFPLLQDIVPKEITGQFFGRLRTWWQSAGFLFIIATAYFFGDNPAWWKFEVLFVIAFIGLVVRALAIIPMVGRKPLLKSSHSQSIVQRFIEVWQIKPLRLAAIYIVVYSFAFNASLPFKIKMMKDIGYSDGIVLAATSMMSLGAIISLRSWGKLADTFGNRSIFSLSHIGMIISTVLWIVIDKSIFGTVMAFVLFFVCSVFHSGNGIAQTRYLFHAIPENKQNHINIINSLSNFSAAIGPVVAGLFLWLLKDFNFQSGAIKLDNYYLFFIFNSVLFIIPHILRRKLRLENEVPTKQVITIMTQPLRNAIGPFINLKLNKNNK